MVVLLLGILAALATLTAAGGLLVLRPRRAAGRGKRRTRVDDHVCGGPFLHWVPDGRGGSRLAGDFIPRPDPVVTTRPQRTGLRRGPRRAG